MRCAPQLSQGICQKTCEGDWFRDLENGVWQMGKTNQILLAGFCWPGGTSNLVHIEGKFALIKTT